MTRPIARPVSFPTNYGWISHNSHAFRPRECDEAAKQLIAATLVRNDTHIRHLLRQCQDRWIFVVTVGQETIYLNIYDPKEVRDPHRKPLTSSSVNRARAVFLEIDRNLELRQLDPAEIDQVMTTAPFLYSSRSLKPSEIRICDSLQRSLAPEALSSTSKDEDRLPPSSDEEEALESMQTSIPSSDPCDTQFHSSSSHWQNAAKAATRAGHKPGSNAWWNHIRAEISFPQPGSYESWEPRNRVTVEDDGTAPFRSDGE